MDDIVVIPNERATPINSEVTALESEDRDTNSGRCITVTIRLIKAITVLGLSSVIVILAVYWSNGRTLLGEFSFQEKNIRTPVFIGIEVFLAVVILISLVDILRGIVTSFRRRKQYALLQDKFEASVWNSFSLLTSKFNLKNSLGGLSFEALAEIGLLAKEGYSKDRNLGERGSVEATNDNEFYIKLTSGIPLLANTVFVDHHIVRVTVVITGAKDVGKTSIFNRIMYGGYPETPLDSVGFNLGLKTIAIGGPNMFNEHKALSIEIQVIDASMGQDDILEQLLCQAASPVILTVVSDVTNPSSIENAGPLISHFGRRGLVLRTSLFLNKTDNAEDISEIRSMYYPTLEGVDLYEVSAKTGYGIIEAFVSMVCKATSLEARISVQNS